MKQIIVHQDGTAIQGRKTLPSILATPNNGWLAVYFAASLFAILYVPYFFPVAPSTAESYIFGYNNHAGIFLLLLCASIGALWTRGLKFDFSSTHPSPKVPLRFLFISLAVEAAACVGMYLRVGRYKPIDDAGYEINKIWLLSAGKSPYKDFEFSYGSALLYVPKWISGVLHLSIPHAYFLFWGIESLLGIVLIFVTLNLIDFPARNRTFLLFLLSFCALLEVPNFCISYTYQRYFFPFFFILLIYNVSRRNSEIIAKVQAGVLAPVFTAILILISPEMAIAFTFACGVILCPDRRTRFDIRCIATYLSTLAACALVFVLASKLHVLDSFGGAARGAISIPITFAPATLTYFSAVFVCACYVVQRFRQKGIQDNTIALIAVAVPLMAAALSRCDYGHILTSGLGFFIPVFFYASVSPRMWNSFRAAFILFVVLPNVFFAVVRSVPTFSYSTLPPFPADGNPSLLYPGVKPTGDGTLEAPLGYIPDAKGFYFYKNIDYGFLNSGADIYIPKNSETVIDQMEQHPQRSLLLKKDTLARCERDPRAARLYVTALTLAPYTARAVHADNVRKPMCDYIRTHYSLSVPATAQNFDYELWTPRP